MERNNGVHYDNISGIWPLFMSNHFHYGYFSKKTYSLDNATDNLVLKLSSLHEINQNTKIIDVGCGIGQASIMLNSKYNCKICGISNSEVGINTAKNRVKESGLEKDMEFQFGDTEKNILPDGPFDIAWIMEVTHLIKNKEDAFKNISHKLNKNGVILMSDLCSTNKFTLKEIVKFKREIEVLHKVFGYTILKTKKVYKSMFQNMGYQVIRMDDISKEVFPTIEAWGKNALANREQIIALSNVEYFTYLLQSFDYLNFFFKNKYIGYFLLFSQKNE